MSLVSLSIFPRAQTRFPEISFVSAVTRIFFVPGVISQKLSLTPAGILIHSSVRNTIQVLS